MQVWARCCINTTLHCHDTTRRWREPVSPLREAVRERLHEAHQCVFFLVRKPESSDELGVHVVGGLGRGPARGALAGVIGAAAPQDVARVVEVHDRLKALKITIVSVGFDELLIRPLIHIAQGWYLNLPMFSAASWRQRASTAEGWLSRLRPVRKPLTPGSTYPDPVGLAA
jgi:hypothetical protein